MNNEEHKPIVSGETEEGFETRKQSEENALQESLVSSGISEEEADELIELLAEKHRTEREINTVFPDIDAYRGYKAAVSFTPTAYRNSSSSVHEEVPTTDELSEVEIGEPHTTPPPDAIEAVSSEITEPSSPEEEEVLSFPESEPWKKIVGYINAVDTLDREQKKAESSLLGGKKERGSTLVADQLEEKKRALALVDERILNKDELREHRQAKAKVERELSLTSEREAYSKDFLTATEDAKGGNIELVLRNIQELPEELVGAIRTNDKATLEQYGVNTWAAGKVARALEAQDVQEEKRLHLERTKEDEHDRDIARAVGTPELARFSRNEIEAVFARKGITATSLAEGLAQLQAEFERSMQEKERAEVAAPSLHKESTVLPPKNFLGRAAHATERGEEIPLHVIENVARMGTPEEKAWAMKEIELRKHAAPLPKEKGKAENLFARMQQLPEDEVPAGALTILLGSKKEEERTWAEALDQKRREQKIPIAPPVQSVQSEVNPTQVSEEYKHETPDVDEHASPEMIETLKEAGIHVPEGKKLTAFEAQKLMRTVLGARGSAQIEANDGRAAKKFIQPVVTNIPEGDPDKHAFDGLGALGSTPPEKDETMEPLIERNLSGKPQFILKEDFQLDAQGEAMQHLIDSTPEVVNLGKTTETQSQHPEKILEETRREEMSAYDEEWTNLPEDHRNLLVREIQKAYPEMLQSIKVKRTSGTIEDWKFGGVRADTGEVRVMSGDMVKDVPILEFIALNIPDIYAESTNQEAVGEKNEEGEDLVEESLIQEDIEAKILVLESLQNPSKEEQEELSKLKWLFENTKASGPLSPEVSLSGEVAMEANLDAQALAPEAKAEVFALRPIDEVIANKFKERFAVEKTELEKITGFSELSEGQQLLVLERMKSVAFEDITAEKVSRYRARIDELSKSDSWWDKIKSVGMKATKQFQLGRMKDEVSSEWLKGTDVDAAAMKRDALEGLVAQALTAKEFGVTEHEGKLSTTFISSEDFGEDIDEATKTQIRDFNEVANRYANKAFVENDDEGKAQLKAQYESGAREMTRLLAEKGQSLWAEEKAAEWRIKLEGAVQMSRFFQDNSEVDKELETAGKNISSAIGFKNLLIERGAYSVGSGAARFLGVSAIGLAAAPIVAAIGGGVMGWRRAKQELSENDLLAVMGEKDKSDDAVHEQSGINVKDRAKNVVESGVLVTKLEHLLKEYDTASEIEKQSLKTRLEARVAYTTRKMEEGLIDVGSARGDRMERMSSLALTLGKAQAELGFADVGENAIETRLNSILDIREEKIEANRKTYLVKQAVKGATMGAAFSGAGMLIGGMLPGHAAAGSFGSGSEHPHTGPDAKAVGDAIRGEHGIGNLPEDVVRSHQESVAKAFEEYMKADGAGRAKIAETLGMTTEQMDAKITGILASPPIEQLPGHIEAPSSSAAEAAALVYGVRSGDNLSHIMKAQLSIFKDLTPVQQENVIQNFIHTLSPQELKEIGITDVNHIDVGQQIHVDRLNEILAAKRIDGEDLITHAQHLNGGVSEAVATSTPGSGAVSEVAPVGEGGIRELTLSPLSPEDATQIESALGRSLSGSESHVLHSLKGLAPLAETDAQKQTLAEALNHLQKEMQASGGRPLTMVEMQRILHEHNGLDAQIKFPEVVQQPLSNVVTETASSTPLPRGIPEGHIEGWKYLPESVRMEESATLGRYYLESDMDHLFGKDVFGNPAKEWLQIRELSAEEIFGAHANEFHSNNLSILNIQDYVKAEGFTIENGYIPNKDESIEQFLQRVHATRVLVGGPRPQTH